MNRKHAKLLAAGVIFGFGLLVYHQFEKLSDIRSQCRAIQRYENVLGSFDLDRCFSDDKYRSEMSNARAQAIAREEREDIRKLREEFWYLTVLVMQRVGDTEAYRSISEEDLKRLPKYVRQFFSFGFDLSSVDGGAPPLADGYRFKVTGSLSIDGADAANTDNQYDGMFLFKAHDIRAQVDMRYIRFRTDMMNQYERVLLDRHCSIGCSGTLFLEVMPMAGADALSVQLIGAALERSEMDDKLEKHQSSPSKSGATQFNVAP